MRFLCMTAIVALCFAIDAHADDMGGGAQDVAQAVLPQMDDPAQHIIEEQLRAFREDDASLAYALNSDDFQHEYRDEKHFMMMMRFTHKPLVNHLSYTFKGTSHIKDRLVQTVEMLNPSGSSTTVMFYLQKNTDGAWLIDGYTILDTEAQPI